MAQTCCAALPHTGNNPSTCVVRTRCAAPPHTGNSPSSPVHDRALHRDHVLHAQAVADAHKERGGVDSSHDVEHARHRGPVAHKRHDGKGWSGVQEGPRGRPGTSPPQGPLVQRTAARAASVASPPCRCAGCCARNCVHVFEGVARSSLHERVSRLTCCRPGARTGTPAQSPPVVFTRGGGGGRAGACQHMSTNGQLVSALSFLARPVGTTHVCHAASGWPCCLSAAQHSSKAAA